MSLREQCDELDFCVQVLDDFCLIGHHDGFTMLVQWFWKFANSFPFPSLAQPETHRHELFYVCLSDLGNAWESYLKKVVIMSVIQIAIVILYKVAVTNKRPPLPPPEEVDPAFQMKYGYFRFGLFGCFGDCSSCLLGCCCNPIALGDAFHSSGVGNYWVIIILNFFSWFPGVSWLLLFYVACCRSSLRGKLGDLNRGCIEDCCCFCYCWSCTTVQVFRQVNGAQGVVFNCPGKLTQMTRVIGVPVTPIVGAPQVVAAPVQAIEMTAAPPMDT